MPVYSLLTEKQTFLDANSNELSGGKLFVYLAGTTTKATSFAETDGVSANSNPIVLNSRGEVPNGLYVNGGATYKLVLAPATDTDPPTSPIWTRDALTPTNDVSTSAGVSEWIVSPYTVAFSNGTTFTVGGDVTSVYQVGRRVRATIGSGNLYGTITSSVFAVGTTTVIVTWDSGALDGTLTAVDYGFLAAENLSVPALLDSVFTILDNSDKTKRVRFGIPAAFPASTLAVLEPPGYNASLANVPVGCLMDYAGATPPNGWLLCDGSAISRTTYAGLFTAIGTVWGPGDGSTTFNIPDLRGRMTIGYGSMVLGEGVTTSSGNGFVVGTNVDGWLTGMPVVLSGLSGFTTSATAGPTYYVVRISSTNIRLATTLALAQNLTPDVTISGSGACNVQFISADRGFGSRGGQDTKAMTINELLSHNHPLSNAGAGSIGGNFAVDFSGASMLTGPRGGNEAMPTMSPYVSITKIIRAL